MSSDVRQGAVDERRHWVRLTRACNNRCLFCHDVGATGVPCIVDQQRNVLGPEPIRRATVHSCQPDPSLTIGQPARRRQACRGLANDGQLGRGLPATLNHRLGAFYGVGWGVRI